MRVIICGAGEVGYNIAAYLSREGNDVTVIDLDPHLIGRINDEIDVSGIVGQASNPNVLAQAGAADADMIVAMTQSDEVNMMACQIAHSLFNIPRKIARIRERAYLDPAWSNLFSRTHLPIDVIISPEAEVAAAIGERLSVPGTTNIISLAEGRLRLAGVLCGGSCPVVNTPLRQLEKLFPGLNIRVMAILRGTKAIIPDADDQMQVGDEAYFCVEASNLKRALLAFGHEEKEARRIVIMGGGHIGFDLARNILARQRDVRLKIIERSQDRALFLSEQLDNVVVMHGDGLEWDILDEADIANVETFIAVTNDDKVNILSSLLAKQYGCQRVITLLRKNTYTPLINSLEIDAVVSPRAITVSTIMRHVRRGRIKALHNLRDGFAEVIEAEVSETSTIANRLVREVPLPPHVIIGAIIRSDTVIMAEADVLIQTGDRVVILAAQGQAQKVERLFSVQVDLF